MTRSATLIALTLALACLLAGCNTVKGVGKDIGEAGSAIERAAQ
ncbi:entericidin, EcnA/B family [Verminephrobacter eiseniae]|nr:entericidin A/B family lipoprotein [Verminephrobacter eiseniae]MCW5262019.1 entericidin, EcnA/B family [Verminephrobacter eiseniae]